MQQATTKVVQDKVLENGNDYPLENLQENKIGSND